MLILCCTKYCVQHGGAFNGLFLNGVIVYTYKQQKQKKATVKYNLASVENSSSETLPIHTGICFKYLPNEYRTTYDIG